MKGASDAPESAPARDEIRDIVNEIIAIKQVIISVAEQEQLLGEQNKTLLSPRKIYL